MNTELPNPQMSVSLNSLPSGGIYLPQVNFYQPRLIMPPPLVNDGLVPTSMDKVIPSISDIISSNIDRGNRSVINDPVLKEQARTRPMTTPYDQTARYSDDELGGYRYNDPNNEYVYGENQSLGEQFVNRNIQMLGNAASAFFGSFTDIPTLGMAGKELATNGVASAAHTLFNNTPVDALNELNKMAYDAAPIYNTRFSEAHPLANVIGEVYSSTGYALGAMAGMLAEDALVGLATGGVGIAPLAALQVGRVGAKVAKLLSSSPEVVNTFNNLIRSGKSATQALDMATTGARIRKGMAGINMVTNNLFEASIEAKEAVEQTETKLTQEFEKIHGYAPSGQDLEDIKSAANSAGNVTLGANVALLSLTNHFEFGDMFKRLSMGDEAFDIAQRGLVKTKIGKNIDELVDAAPKVESVPTGKYSGLVNRIKSGGALVRSSIGETVEEGGQFIASKAAEDYYTLKYNKQGLDTVDRILKSVGYATGELLGTEEGWLNMLAGLGSGVAIGGARKALGLDKDSPKPNSEDILNQLNAQPLSEILREHPINRENNLALRSTAYQTLSEKENDAASFFEKDSLQQARIFTWSMAALRNGQMDGFYLNSRMEQLEAVASMTEEDFVSLFNMRYTDENRAKIANAVRDLKDQVNSIKKNYDRVNTAYNNPYYSRNPSVEQLNQYQIYENYKTELVFHLSKQERNQRLISDILPSEINKFSTNINPELVSRLSTKSGSELTLLPTGQLVEVDKKGENDGLASIKRDIEKEIKDLTELSSSSIDIATPEDKQKIKDNTELVTKINEALTNWDNTSSRVDIAREILKRENINVNNLDISRLLGIGLEMNRAKASLERSFDLFNKLASTDGFKTFVKQEKKANDKFVKDTIKEAQDTSQEETILTSEQEFHDIFAGRIDKDRLDQILNELAAKLKNNQTLTEKEKKVYKKFKDVVDGINYEYKELIINDKDYDAFKDNTIKDARRDLILNQLAIKINVSDVVSLTPREEEFYKAYKQNVDDRVTALRNEPVTNTDDKTGLSVGDIFKSTETKDEFEILSFRKGFIDIKNTKDGKKITWTMSNFYTKWDAGKINLTGLDEYGYTADDLAKIGGKYDYNFLFNFGSKVGGARWMLADVDDGTDLRLLAIRPKNMGDAIKIDGKDDIILPVVFKSRAAIKALLDYDKTGKMPDTNNKPYIYSGRERDVQDKRTIEQILEQYKANNESGEMDLIDVLNTVINSKWATASEADLARFMLPYIKQGTVVKLTAGDSTYSPKDGIAIGIKALDSSPMEIMVVHETLHMLTVDSVKDNKSFAKELQDIYDKALEQAKSTGQLNKFRGLHATKHTLDEFIAEAFTNPEFMNFLANTPASTIKTKSLWSKFIQTIKRLLNVSDDSLITHLTDLVFSEIDIKNAINQEAALTYGMVFNPTVLFTKVADRFAGKSINPKLLDMRNSGTLTPEELKSTVNVTKRATLDASGNPQTLNSNYTKYTYTNDLGRIIQFDRIVKRSPSEVLEVKSGLARIGIVQPISTWAYIDDNGIQKPLTEMKESEYPEVTKNHPATYRQFMNIINKHTQLENSLLSKPVDESIQAKDMDVSFTINKGALALTLNTDATTISDLSASFPKYNGKSTPFIVSLSKYFDTATETWVDRKPAIISGLPVNNPIHKFLEELVDSKLSELRDRRSRYFTAVYLDGDTYNPASVEFVIGHPAKFVDTDFETMLKQIKDLTEEKDEISHVVENVFIADNTGKKREIALLVKKGTLLLSYKSPTSDKASYTEIAGKKKLEEITNFKEILDLLNKNLPKGATPFAMADFRVDIKDDGKVLPDILAASLKSAVLPQIRNTSVQIQSDMTMNSSLPETPAEEVKQDDLPTPDQFAAFFNSSEDYDEDEDNYTAPSAVVAPEPPATPPTNVADEKAQALKKNNAKGAGLGKRKYELVRPKDMASDELVQRYKDECGT